MRTFCQLLMGAAVTMSAPAAAQEAVGDWIGTLDAGGTRLRIAVHIEQAADGTLAGTLDSLDQRAFGLALAGIVQHGARLEFAVPVVSGSYTGEWDPAAMGWRGSWRQGGAALPLALAPGGPPPQVPIAPEPLPADWRIPADAGIGEAIAARIAERPGQGIVVGVLEHAGRRIVAGGPQGAAPFDGDTVFEIGSITKVFTALLLADMANKGEVSLDDPAETYLPAGATMPSRNGRKITLADLSTHSSSLPRLPDNMPYGDPSDPYADYGEALLLEFLSGYQLPHDIGSQPEYSNLAVGLLGYLLGRAAGTDYETLLRERITGPLGMDDTSIALSPDQQARFAPGFDIYLRPAGPWHLAALAGAGAIRSTGNDMLKFAAAALDPASPIAGAMRTALSVRRETGSANVEQALGWQVVHPEAGRELIMHGGGTGGYRSHLALEPSSGRAVVALANAAAEPSAADLALHLLVGAPMAPTPRVPAPPPPPAERTEVTLPVAELDRVVGRYDFGDGINVITREGDRLLSSRAGVQTLPIYPEAPLQFFFKAIDAQYRFTTDEAGNVDGVVFTMPGLERTGKRIQP
jgi:D-alanyl-D-alanine-carboxypeptidase/D-alanyl-D-alanine-endopeptidase